MGSDCILTGGKQETEHFQEEPKGAGLAASSQQAEIAPGASPGQPFLLERAGCELPHRVLAAPEPTRQQFSRSLQSSGVRATVSGSLSTLACAALLTAWDSLSRACST